MLCFLTQPKESRNELKNKKQAECQKIKLCGSPRTKELKKHSFRLAGGVQLGSQGREDTWQGGSQRIRRSHICMQINQEEQLGSKTVQARVLAWGNKASKPLAVKPVGVAVVGETPTLTGQFIGRPTESYNKHKATHPGISTRRTQFACGQQGK